MQHHKHLQAYFTSDDWDTLRSLKIDFNTKAKTLVSRCRLLGLRHPSESTFVRMVGILLLSCHAGNPEEIEVNAQSALATLRDIKRLLKTWKAGRADGLAEYPAGAQDMKTTAPEIYNAAYARGEPVPCPLDSLALGRVIEALPARKSHGALNMSVRVQRVPQRDGPLQAALQGMLMRSAMAQPEDIPGLTMFGQPRPARSHTHLALEGPNDNEQQRDSPTPKACPAQDAEPLATAEGKQVLALEDVPNKALAPELAREAPPQEPGLKAKKEVKDIDDMAAVLLKKLGKLGASKGSKKEAHEGGSTPERTSEAAIRKRPSRKRPSGSGHPDE